MKVLKAISSSIALSFAIQPQSVFNYLKFPAWKLAAPSRLVQGCLLYLNHLLLYLHNFLWHTHCLAHSPTQSVALFCCPSRRSENLYVIYVYVICDLIFLFSPSLRLDECTRRLSTSPSAHFTWRSRLSRGSATKVVSKPSWHYCRAALL